jgi:rhodanese-related sulfurtransferase
VDIRRPDEWAATGVPENALLLDLRQDNFSGALLAHLQGDMRRPVALICARGVRSAQVAADLRQIGFSRVLDVPEGMLGSGAGVGWIEQGLPLRQP